MDIKKLALMVGGGALLATSSVAMAASPVRPVGVQLGKSQASAATFSNRASAKTKQSSALNGSVALLALLGLGAAVAGVAIVAGDDNDEAVSPS